MPQALFVGIGLALESALGAFLISYSAALSAGALLAGGLALSATQAKKAKRKAKDAYNASQVDRLANIQSPLAPRELVLGRARKGGQVFFKASTGTNNSTFVMCIALAGHEIDAVEAIYFNDAPVTLDGNGNVTDAPYSSTVRLSASETGTPTHTPIPGTESYYTGTVGGPEGDIEPAFASGPGVTTAYQYLDTTYRANVRYYLGTPGQAADATMISIFPTEWTAAHRAQAVAYLICEFHYDETSFPNGLPAVTAVIRGAKVYDPRYNLLTYSEDLSNAAWVKTNATVSSNASAVAAPDGTMTADLVYDNAVNIDHRVHQVYTVPAATQMAFSAHVRANGRTQVFLVPTDGTNGVKALFDLATGDASSADFGAGFVGHSASMEQISDEWWRCTVSYTRTAGGSTQHRVNLGSGGLSTYLGSTGNIGAYVWGAQLVEGALALPYSRTAAAAVTPATAWSRNTALQMRHVYGHASFGKATITDAEEIRFVRAADACDRSTSFVVAGVPTVAPLYASDLVGAFGASAGDLFDDLSQAMAGSWAFAGGELHLRPGVYLPPVIGVTDADLAVISRNGAAEEMHPISISVHRERAAKFNVVNAQIWDAEQDYKQVTLTPLKGDALITRDGVELVQSVTLPAVGYAARALHICGVMMRDARDPLTIVVPCKLRLYPVELFDTVAITLSRYGWGSNLLMQSNTQSTTPWTGTPTAVIAAETDGDETFWTYTKTLISTSEHRGQIFGYPQPGETYTLVVSLLADTVTTCQVGLYDGLGTNWGSAGDASTEILSGPGTGSSAHGLVSISGLSAVTPTKIRITRTYTVSSRGHFLVYPGGSTSTTIGDSVKVASPQLVSGFAMLPYVRTTAKPIMGKEFQIIGREWANGFLQLTLKETAEEIFEVDAEFSAQGYAANTALPDAWYVPPMGTITVASGTDQLHRMADGTVVSGMRLSWPTIDDARVTSGGSIEIQYRPAVSALEWTSVVVSGDETQAVIRDVQDQVYYVIRTRAKSTLAVGAWGAHVYHQVIGKTAPASDVTGLTYAMEPSGARLLWDSVTDRDLAVYEVRTGGVDWGSATWLATVKTTDYLWPIYPAGTHVARVKAIDTSGNYSTTEITVSVVISAPSVPASLVATIVGVKAMLTWTEPVTHAYPISHYLVKQGATWGSATLDAELLALTYRVPIDWIGGRTFFVAAVDSQGNEGSATSVLATVVAPGAVSGVAFAITSDAITLSWSPNAVSAGMLPVQSYEVRRGASFAAGTPVSVTDTTRHQIVVDWAASSETFWVRATDVNGNTGIDTGNVAVTIGSPTAVSASAAIVAANAVISWTPSAQVGLPIRKYEIRTGASWAAGTLVASVLDKTLSVPVDWVGDQTFWVSAIDTAGNYATAASVVITVNLPAAPVIDVSDSQVGSTLLDQYRLTWSESVVDTTRLPVDHYSVGYGGTTLGTIKGTTWMAKADWGGDRSYWVTAHDVNGNASAQAPQTLSVSAPSAPTTLTLQVVDNNVLLYWSGAVGTLPIESYELAKEATFDSGAAATYIGKKSGGFTSVFETVSGTYTYYLRGIDSAGNSGSTKSASATVAQPPDYVLNVNWLSTFSGTKSSAIVDADGSLLIPVNLTQTWTTHFTDNAWDQPSDQTGAGYDRYAMPTPASGYYQETFDYGTSLAASKVTVTPTVTSYGTPSVQCDISVSPDNSTWTDYTNTWSVYATAFRYVKVRITVTASGNNDLYDIAALNVTLDSKIRSDFGTQACLSGDAGGTTCTFNVAFVDVTSITVTPAGTTAIFPVYDFVDAPNPTDFKVLVFDHTGSRVSATVSWSARGY